MNKVYQKPINLKAEKEKLLHGTQEPLKVDASSLTTTPIRTDKKSPKTKESENNKSSITNTEESKWTPSTPTKEIPISSSEKAIESLENRALAKEKELSMRFLKAKTKEDVYKLYEKSVLQIKYSF